MAGEGSQEATPSVGKPAEEAKVEEASFESVDLSELSRKEEEAARKSQTSAASINPHAVLELEGDLDLNFSEGEDQKEKEEEKEPEVVEPPVEASIAGGALLMALHPDDNPIASVAAAPKAPPETESVVPSQLPEPAEEDAEADDGAGRRKKRLGRRKRHGAARPQESTSQL